MFYRHGLDSLTRRVKNVLTDSDQSKPTVGVKARLKENWVCLDCGCIFMWLGLNRVKDVHIYQSEQPIGVFKKGEETKKPTNQPIKKETFVKVFPVK